MCGFYPLLEISIAMSEEKAIHETLYTLTLFYDCMYMLVTRVNYMRDSQIAT